MIPYIELHVIHLGPIPIQIWGTLVALGFIFGAIASAKMAKRRGLNPKIVYDLAAWILLASMIGGRLFVLFYQPAYYIAHPIDIFKIWEGGMSIYGGFVGALVVSLIYLKKKKVDVWKYADATIFGLPLGMFVGRIGCFLIHDHPGTATDFFLGVKYPDGVVRHDLGLYESLNGLMLFVIFLIMAKMKVREGAYLAVFCLWYGATRFALDFLRVSDATYLSLTPAQYFSLLLFGTGIFLAYRLRAPKLKPN